GSTPAVADPTTTSASVRPAGGPCWPVPRLPPGAATATAPARPRAAQPGHPDTSIPRSVRGRWAARTRRTSMAELPRADPGQSGDDRVPLDPPADDPFGPRPVWSTGPRLDTSLTVDRIVDTHCCFCGQQCGIRLKVRDEQVIGFEPRYDFPFNRGMLCPKGVKRYLQGSHPDRLLHALERDPAAPGGFRPLAYEQAIARAAAAIDRVQTGHGRHVMPVLSGASVTTEKAYLMGKFAHLALATSNIDYNGRLCMVSAGAGNALAFGIDRAANPWSDILGA